MKEELQDEVQRIFATLWSDREGRKIPEPEDVALGNDAVKFDEAVVLYADLAESTALVDAFSATFAAEVYKAYLHAATRIIRKNDGVITAFDGDRVMAVFVGDSKRTNATRSALNLNHAVHHIINPAIKRQYADKNYSVSHAVGIDVSKLFVARTGIRNNNDLVWVGRAANYAAKLCSLREGGYASYITEDVYKSMSDDLKSWQGKHLWEVKYWTEKKIFYYRSSWTWGF